MSANAFCLPEIWILSSDLWASSCANSSSSFCHSACYTTTSSLTFWYSCFCFERGAKLSSTPFWAAAVASAAFSFSAKRWIKSRKIIGKSCQNLCLLSGSPRFLAKMLAESKILLSPHLGRKQLDSLLSTFGVLKWPLEFLVQLETKPPFFLQRQFSPSRPKSRKTDSSFQIHPVQVPHHQYPLQLPCQL